MVPEMEKPRITEIKVRMDCNGCVNKIKKALHGVTGIHDIYVDFSEQKISVIGWADPQMLVKAIKKTRKSAIICSHTEQSDQPAEQTHETSTSDGGAPPRESMDPAVGSTQTEATQPTEAPREQPHPENQPPEEDPSTESCNDAKTSQSTQPPMPKDHEEVHVIHHYSPDYGYRYPYSPNFQQGYTSQWIGPRGNPGCGAEPFQPPQPIYVAHSHNTYKPSPYVTEYEHPRSPPRHSRYSGQRNELHGDPGFQGEPFQPPRPVYATHNYNTYKSSPYVTEYAHPRSPSRYSHYSAQGNELYNDPGIRGEPFRPPQPVYATHSYKSTPYAMEYAYPRSPPRYSHYSGQGNKFHGDAGIRGEPFQPPQPIHATHSYNTYKSSPYVTEYAYPRSPPRYSHYSGQRNEFHNDAGIQGEPFQPPQPIHATHNYNRYKSSPYVTEYAYPPSPSTYSHYSRANHYREDYHYHSGNNSNGNITSMFSDENPNACRIV